MKNYTQTPDLKAMTEDELFAFLDAEATRIRRENVIIPLSPMYSKMAKVATESQNQFSKPCKCKSK